jgi:hypothetical protein
MSRILESTPMTTAATSETKDSSTSIREEVERSLKVVSKLGLLVG